MGKNSLPEDFFPCRGKNSFLPGNFFGNLNQTNSAKPARI